MRGLLRYKKDLTNVHGSAFIVVVLIVLGKCIFNSKNNLREEFCNAFDVVNGKIFRDGIWFWIFWVDAHIENMQCKHETSNVCKPSIFTANSAHTKFKELVKVFKKSGIKNSQITFKWTRCLDVNDSIACFANFGEGLPQRPEWRISSDCYSQSSTSTALDFSTL